MNYDEPKYDFLPMEPAACIARDDSTGESIYSQRGYWWYFNGSEAVVIPKLGHLNQQELLALGRDTLRVRGDHNSRM